MKEFVRDLVNGFEIGSNTIRVGVQKYSSGTNTEFNLDDYYDKNTVKTQVMNVVYTGGSTNTGGAIAYLRTTMFSTANGDRAGVRNIGVILTDGRSNSYSYTATEAATARNANMTIFAIGIGSGIPVAELNEMATDPDSDFAFAVSDFSALAGIQTAFHAQACSPPPIINGGLSSWTSWGACSTTCELGTMTRARTCSNPPPANGGTDCTGDLSETSSCNLGPCPVDGVWNAWQAWSACSVTCMGVGVRGRVRDCDNPAAQHGGAPCSGSGSETQTCDKSLALCSAGNGWALTVYSTTPGTPVDGGFNQWGQWSACTKTCGAGIRLRLRACNTPVPQFGGLICSGDFVQKEICGNVACSNSSSYVQTCPERYFDCKDGNITCIHYLEKCDCTPHCDDASDEDPEYAGCAGSTLICNNPASICDPTLTMTLLLLVVAAFLPTVVTCSDLKH